MKKLRIILSLGLLIEARSFAPKIIKISAILLKPVPGFFKSIHAWMPATAGIVATHALSGATTAVKSSQGNSISVQAGENLTYQFYTSRYTAGSYSISGLPNGLSYDGSNTITGKISEAGTYNIQIIGHRYSNQYGKKTPTFTLEISVTEPSSTSNEGENLLSQFSDITDLGNQWYQTWLGIMYITNNGNWAFHSDLGWMYAQSIAQDSFWLYDKDLGWLYTSKNLNRFFYRHSNGGWLYQLDSTSDNRFWDYKENSEVQ